VVELGASYLELGLLMAVPSLLTIFSVYLLACSLRLLQALALSSFPPVVTTAISGLTFPEGRGQAFGAFFTSIGLAPAYAAKT